MRLLCKRHAEEWRGVTPRGRRYYRAACRGRVYLKVAVFRASAACDVSAARIVCHSFGEPRRWYRLHRFSASCVQTLQAGRRPASSLGQSISNGRRFVSCVAAETAAASFGAPLRSNKRHYCVAHPAAATDNHGQVQPVIGSTKSVQVG